MASIQGIYIALFGRPADPAGLAFWEAETNGGQDLSGLIGRLTQSDEYLSRFDGMSNAEIVNTIYQSLFGRDADPGGLAFFVEALENGTQTIESIAINILDGAQNEDALIIANKIAAANQFTQALDTPEELAAYNGPDAEQAGRDFLENITDDPETIPDEDETDTAIQGLTTPPDEAPAPGGPGGSTPPSPPPTYDVKDGDSIQEAIDNADFGATITIADGTYNEDVVLSKSVKLVGQSTDGVVIDGFVHLEGATTSLTNATVVNEITGSWKDTDATLSEHGLVISGEGASLTNVNLEITDGGGSAYDIYISGDFAKIQNVSVERLGPHRGEASLFVDEAGDVVIKDSDFDGQIGAFAASDSTLTVTNTSIDTPATDKIWITGDGYTGVPDDFVAHVESDDIGYVATTFAGFLKFYETLEDAYAAGDTDTVTNLQGDAVSFTASIIEDFNDGLADMIADDLDDYGTVTVDAGVAILQDGNEAMNQAGGIVDTTGPFTRFDGYRTNTPDEVTTRVEIYLDPEATTDGRGEIAEDEGFSYSVAAKGKDNGLLQDFIFHVARDDEGLFVSSSNNTNFEPVNNISEKVSSQITEDGWYTFEHKFYNDGGKLSVDLTVYDDSESIVYSNIIEARNGTVNFDDDYGGNRYGWFTNIDVIGGIEVDNWELSASYF